jgi:hypothetical protein
MKYSPDLGEYESKYVQRMYWLYKQFFDTKFEDKEAPLNDQKQISAITHDISSPRLPFVWVLYSNGLHVQYIRIIRTHLFVWINNILLW